MYQQFDTKSLDLSNLAKQKGNYQLVLFFLGIIGALFLVFGIVSWPLAIVGVAWFGLGISILSIDSEESGETTLILMKRAGDQILGLVCVFCENQLPTHIIQGRH